jgi:hypothetical protein
LGGDERRLIKKIFHFPFFIIFHLSLEAKAFLRRQADILAMTNEKWKMKNGKSARQPS